MSDIENYPYREMRQVRRAELDFFADIPEYIEQNADLIGSLSQEMDNPFDALYDFTLDTILVVGNNFDDSDTSAFGDTAKNDAELEAQLRHYTREIRSNAYVPGFLFMSKCLDVIPAVASAANVPVDRWADIAAATVNFAKLFASHGTRVQALLGQITRNPDQAYRLDPSFYELDRDTGIALKWGNVKTLRGLMEIPAPESYPSFLKGSDSSCVALQITHDGKDDFQRYWNSWVAVARKHLYPNIKPSPTDVSDAREEPLATYEASMAYARKISLLTVDFEV